MKLSIITDQISQDFETACRIISEEGMDRIEIHSLWGKTIEQLDEAEVTKIKNLTNFYDLHVHCLASTLFLMTPLYPNDQLKEFSSEFITIRGDLPTHLSYLRKTIDIAKQLDCTMIRIFPFRAPENRKIVGDTSDQEAMVRSLSVAISMAEKAGITLVMENCPHCILQKGKMTVDVVKRIDSPHLQLLYDPANSYRANVDRIPFRYLEGSLIEELRLIVPYIAHMHIKDYHFVEGLHKPYLHVPLLKGEVPYSQILRILKDSGYEGVLSLEPEIGFEGTMDSLSTLRKLIKSL